LKREHGDAEKDPARETRVAKIEKVKRGPLVFTLAAILFYHSVETQPRFATASSAAIYIKPDPGTIATFYSYTASGGAGERALASMRGRTRAKEMSKEDFHRRGISVLPSANDASETLSLLVLLAISGAILDRRRRSRQLRLLRLIGG